MLSLWRRSGLRTTIIRSHRTCQVAHSKDAVVSLWALSETFKAHVTIRLRHHSSVIHVKHEGFRAHNGVFIKPSDTVEIEDGTFIRVKEVLHDAFNDRHWIIGWRFVRNVKTFGLPKQDPNEVYWVVYLARNDPRPAADQALVKVDDSQILRKTSMSMVNETYPSHQKRIKAGFGAPDDGVLYCRWKHVIMTKTWKWKRPLDAFRLLPAKIVEASFQRLRAEDFDDGHNDPFVDERLFRHRLDDEKKEADTNMENKEPDSLSSAIEALSLDDNRGESDAPAAYTFADVCCGAGGASRGAEMAGLQLRWALDHDADACETYRLNFPHVRLHQKPLQELINMRHEDLKVDIMHISPPCQAFSQANTTPNRTKNAENIAASMEIGTCLDVARPRIATLEQTSGLMSLGYVEGRHSQHFGNVIAQFTSRNYSVGWKNADLAEWGLAQPRKRLLMIASWYVLSMHLNPPYPIPFTLSPSYSSSNQKI